MSARVARGASAALPGACPGLRGAPAVARAARVSPATAGTGRGP